jgi:hypothetical protein
MREAIIDTTRSVSVESDIVEINGIDREIWAIVVRCPIDGISVSGQYYASREEAWADLVAMYA